MERPADQKNSSPSCPVKPIGDAFDANPPAGAACPWAGFLRTPNAS
jgi:hypothetical protein